jgi:hypothetical protein
MVDVERFDLEPDRKILHGIVKHLDVETLKTLTTNEEKIPYMLDILGLASTSPRLRASMLEMQQTISTWPQLGSAVTMGGGITADVCRRILLNQFTDSGRYYVDIDELIGNKAKQKNISEVPASGSSPLSWEQMRKVVSEWKDAEPSEMDEADWKHILEAAIQAPSYANKQPWRWISHKKKLFLFKAGEQNYTDPGEQNAYLSLGAAVENVIVKGEELGYAATPRISSIYSSNAPLVVFSFAKSNKAPSALKHLSPFIFSRHTNRKAGNEFVIPANILQEIQELVKGVEGAELEIIQDKTDINKVAEIAGITERLRLLNPFTHAGYFKEEIKWPGDGDILEGVDIRTLELSPPAQTAYEVVSDPRVAVLLNDWRKGSVFEKLTQSCVASSSAIGLISMPSNALVHLIDGGRAMERVWLGATKNNLAFQPICLPLYLEELFVKSNTDKTRSSINFSELNALKAQLSLIFSKSSTREAVFLFRLSEAGKTQIRSLRRPLSEVYVKF